MRNPLPLRSGPPEGVGAVLDVSADEARKTDASIMEGNEHASSTMIKMLARSERRLSAVVVQLRIR